jgi:hypothetical protein
VLEDQALEDQATLPFQRPDLLATRTFEVPVFTVPLLQVPPDALLGIHVRCVARMLPQMHSLACLRTNVFRANVFGLAQAGRRQTGSDHQPLPLDHLPGDVAKHVTQKVHDAMPIRCRADQTPFLA